MRKESPFAVDLYLVYLSFRLIPGPARARPAQCQSREFSAFLGNRRPFRTCHSLVRNVVVSKFVRSADVEQDTRS